MILYKHLYSKWCVVGFESNVDTKNTCVEKRLDSVLGGLVIGNLNDVRGSL